MEAFRPGYRRLPPAFVAHAQHDEQKTLSLTAYALQRDDPDEREFFVARTAIALAVLGAAGEATAEGVFRGRLRRAAAVEYAWDGFGH